MSDNELDAELLALAGGDESSSEEEDNVQQSRQTSDLKGSGDKSPPRRGVAQKLKARGRARRAQRESDDEDSFGDSEPESSPRKARSPSTDEVDADAPLYPIEGKFRSEADRADIMGMTEIEREEILAERAAETQRRIQNQALRKLLDSNRNNEADKKRKAGTADLDDGQRKSSRQKTKASDKIEAYKRQRELKGAQRARGEERRRGDRQSRSPSRGFSERDASGESEVEWDDGRRASPPPRKDEPPPEIQDFDGIRVGRSHLAKHLYDPVFESMIKGCYCRVNCGQDSTGPKYKVGLIKGFHEGRPYTLEGANGKKVYTNQYVVIAHGKKEKEYTYATCSDGRFTSSEFAEFKATLADDGVRFPTKRQLTTKMDDLKHMRNYTWSEAEISAKMDKRDNMRKTYVEYHRERITKRMNEAKARGDDATAARCVKDLADLNAGGVVGTNSKSATPIKKEDQQSRLAALNKINRKTNSEEIRKALIAENMAKQKARHAAIAKLREEEAKKAEAAVLKAIKAEEDLFGGSDTGTPKVGRSGTSTPLNGHKEKKAFGQFSKKKNDDEVIAAMDLEIDIDI